MGHPSRWVRKGWAWEVGVGEVFVSGTMLPHERRHPGANCRARRAASSRGRASRVLDALAAPYGELVVVSHHFDADPDFDPHAEGSPADHAWITILDPTVQGQWIKVYFDGIDRDLTLTIGEVGYFEWWDHSDANSVVAEVAGICAGVMAGDIWEWRTPHERGCEMVGPDGRRWRVTRGRRLWKFSPR